MSTPDVCGCRAGLSVALTQALRCPGECSQTGFFGTGGGGGKKNLTSVLYKIIIYFFCRDHHDHTFYLATNMPTTSNDSTPDHRKYKGTGSESQNLQRFEVTGTNERRRRAGVGAPPPRAASAPRRPPPTRRHRNRTSEFGGGYTTFIVLPPVGKNCTRITHSRLRTTGGGLGVEGGGGQGRGGRYKKGFCC